MFKIYCVFHNKSNELHSYYVFRAKVYFVLNEQPMEVIRRCKAQEDGWRVS